MNVFTDSEVWRRILRDFQATLNFIADSAQFCKKCTEKLITAIARVSRKMLLFSFIGEQPSPNQSNLDSCVKTFQFSFEPLTFPTGLTAFIFLLRRYSHAIHADNGCKCWHMSKFVTWDRVNHWRALGAIYLGESCDGQGGCIISTNAWHDSSDCWRWVAGI